MKALYPLVFALLFSFAVFGGRVAAQADAVLVIGMADEPPFLAPRSADLTAQRLRTLYARDLWDWDAEHQIFPVMADTIPTLANGMVATLDDGSTAVTIRLKDDLRWSDGEPITVDDCLFGHELMLDRALGTLPRGTYAETVQALEKIDDLTMRITYNSAFPDYLSQNMPLCSLPEHILRPELEAAGTLDNAQYFTGVNVVGYAPYVLQSWTRGNDMQFVANPYWLGDAPHYAEIRVRFIPAAAQMLQALANGEIDIAFDIPATEVPAYRTTTAVFSVANPSSTALWLNMGNGGSPALTDMRVRQALVLALDRPALAETLVGQGAQVPQSWYADQFWTDTLPVLNYDVLTARQFLTDAGWVDDDGDETDDDFSTVPTVRLAKGVAGVMDGTPLVLRFFTTDDPLRQAYQRAIQTYLNEVGVTTQGFSVPDDLLFASFLERGILATGDFDLAIFALSSDSLSPFADAQLWFGCDAIPSATNPNGSNGWGSCAPDFDAQDALVGSTLDPAERLTLAHEAQTSLMALNFWHGLYQQPVWYAVRTDKVRVGEHGTLPANFFNRIETWQPAGA